MSLYISLFLYSSFYAAHILEYFMRTNQICGMCIVQPCTSVSHDDYDMCTRTNITLHHCLWSAAQFQHTHTHTKVV